MKIAEVGVENRRGYFRPGYLHGFRVPLGGMSDCPKIAALK
jgi:hypothetical protein